MILRLGLSFILLCAGASFAQAATCSFPEGNMEITVLGGDPSVKALIGNPTTEVTLVPGGDGCFRHHQSGSVYWSKASGAHYVLGAIRQKWSALGWERSFLKYPLTNETTPPDRVGRFNHFQGGSIYWHPSFGAFEVHGDIRSLWSSMSWETGLLGYPTSDETVTPDTKGRFNHFQQGSIYWKANLGPHFVLGSIHQYWADHGWERNESLGYPISNELAPKPGSANRYSDFENGVVSWNGRSGAVTELGRFPLASRDRADLEVEAQKQLANLMAPYGDQAYIDEAPTIVGVTDYTRQAFNTVASREIQLKMRIKYKAEFLGIDGLLPDPYTDLDLWLSFRANPTASGTDLVMTPSRAVMRTHVPAPTSGFISAETINAKLKDVLKGVIGKQQVMGTLPPSLTVLSVKVMLNGDLNTYIESL